MTLSPMEPNVNNNFCLGHKSTQVCRLHEERPSTARKNLISGYKSSERAKFCCRRPRSIYRAESTVIGISRMKGRLRVEKALLTIHFKILVLGEELGEQRRVSAGNPFWHSDSAVKLSVLAGRLENPFHIFICIHWHCDSRGIYRRRNSISVL
jgi:hypothetical protein